MTPTGTRVATVYQGTQAALRVHRTAPTRGTFPSLPREPCPLSLPRSSCCGLPGACRDC